MTKLAILIPTLSSRAHLLSRLITELDRQRAGKDVIVILHEDQGQKTTGQKRNELMQSALDAGSEYISFVDDDDMVGPNYVDLNLEGIAMGFDCNSLKGQIYWEGKPGKPFFHSLIYDQWYEDKNGYYRCPNHLNCIRLDKVKDIPFQDKNFGEDGNWSMDIQKAGVLKTEYQIKEVLYHYYVTKKK